MQAVSYTEASENLEAMIHKVVADRARLAITREGSEVAALVSASEWTLIKKALATTTS
ncbi:type II toxin-antitoxin system Phd/YefM family antitoxin [uncultured Sphingomonas sp.]|uniref:type II toxin-antitoxin system Phd/YefM family antitoxin n=1 Tax=uncultured Sphingomonas sp. TaxID=158754 RepID=UPI003748D0AE